MIEHLTGFPDDVLGFVYNGRVTKSEYDDVLIPAVVKALDKHKRLRVYCEIKSEFTGLDVGAVWEDLKVGIGHLTSWERVAVVTDINWIEQTMRIFNFLMPCPMRAFPTSEAAQARAWITAVN